MGEWPERGAKIPERREREEKQLASSFAQRCDPDRQRWPPRATLARIINKTGNDTPSSRPCILSAPVVHPPPPIATRESETGGEKSAVHRTRTHLEQRASVPATSLVLYYSSLSYLSCLCPLSRSLPPSSRPVLPHSRATVPQPKTRNVC